jgi:Integrase core domain
MAAVPYRTHTVLTNNGIQFILPATARHVDGPTATWITQMFDMRCNENGIEHWLTKIRHQWTSGQVERMNQTIKEASVKRYHYDSHAQLTAHLNDFIDANNYGRRLKTLEGLTPFEYICKIWTSEPDRFTINPTHQMLGLNSQFTDSPAWPLVNQAVLPELRGEVGFHFLDMLKQPPPAP